MNIVDKSKEIVKYICENFEEWDLDDPVEEEYIDDYEDLAGAKEEELKSFEEAFEVELPESFKELYRYKNGSGYMCALPCVVGERDMTFCLMSLDRITSSKGYFQNKDALLADYPDFSQLKILSVLVTAELSRICSTRGGSRSQSIVTAVT